MSTLDRTTEPTVMWRKSTRSADTNCVEVAAVSDVVLVRDSKDPDGPRLILPTSTWQEFLASLDDLAVG